MQLHPSFQIICLNFKYRSDPALPKFSVHGFYDAVISTSKFNNGVPAVVTNKRSYFFQSVWLEQFKWAVLEEGRIYCSPCRDALKLKLFTAAIVVQQAFISKEFKNWKKGVSYLQAHEQSEQHVAAVFKLRECNETSLTNILADRLLQSQRKARNALRDIITSLKYLARQGLAIRGHNQDDGNFINLLKLRGNDLADLTSWLKRSNPLTAPDIKNEILGILSHAVLRKLLVKVKSSNFYSVLLDKTSDVSGKEQVSFCVRVVDDGLIPQEYFLGLYEVTSTTADKLKEVFLDISKRFDMKLENLRGQCDHGASNMSGIYKVLAAQISELESRAIYIHCYAHSLNLAIKDAAQGTPELRNTMGTIHELAIAIKASRKRLAKFKVICDDLDGNAKLRPQPLCPTRFLLRVRSFRAVKENYGALLVLMEEIGNSRDGVAPKAFGIFKQLLPQTYFCVLLCMELFDYLETLSTTIQTAKISVSAAVEAARTTEKALGAHTAEVESFEKIWQCTMAAVTTYDLEQPKLPRNRKVPSKLKEAVPERQSFQNVEDLYRNFNVSAYKDALEELKSRFSQPGIKKIMETERIILNWSEQNDSLEEELDFICSVYELDKIRLVTNLNTLKYSGVSFSSISGLLVYLKGLQTETRALYAELIKLINVLLLVPITSCSAERSFSVLSRVKSYLRSTIGQKRLNDLCLLHAFPDYCDNTLEPRYNVAS